METTFVVCYKFKEPCTYVVENWPAVLRCVVCATNTHFSVAPIWKLVQEL